MPVTNQAGLDLIKKYEGLQLTAYADPVGIPTIGYGHTRGVMLGQVITEAQAEDFLAADLHSAEQDVQRLVQVVLTPNQFAALVSFVYNLGAEALAGSTLLRKLNASDYLGASEEFAKWTKAGGEVLPGLVARRAAEAELFRTSTKPSPVAIKKPSLVDIGVSAVEAATPVKMVQKKLVAPYYSQLESHSGEGERICFSACCAMLAEQLSPGCLAVSGLPEDIYLAVVEQAGGNSNNPDSQVKALAHFGITARERTDCNWRDVDAQLDAGIAVPIAILHHGPLSSPYGGHWILAIGRTNDGKHIYHDPYGELDVIGGIYPTPGTGGKSVAYTDANIERRWSPEGPNHGYAMIALSPKRGQ